MNNNATCSENNSASCSDFNHTSESSHDAFIISSILSFVENILIVLLGSQIIYCVYINKTLRDPVSVVMASIAISVMLFTIPNNLLGLSLITDLPLLGDCSNLTGNMFIIFPAIQLNIDNFSVGLIATIQFLIIKYGRKKVTNCKVLPVFAVLIILSVLLAIIANAVEISLEQGASFRVKIRGSLCLIHGNAYLAIAIEIALGYLVPFTVTMVMSFVSHRKIKNSVIEMDSDHSVIRSVLIMSVTTILAAFVTKIPLAICVFWATNSESIVAYQMITMLIPLEPLCIVFLLSTIHKTIRHELVETICKCIKCGARPEPNDDTI